MSARSLPKPIIRIFPILEHKGGIYVSVKEFFCIAAVLSLTVLLFLVVIFGCAGAWRFAFR